MKFALLVALREYAENAKTKGFWIGIMIFPLMILVMTQIPKFLEKATPTRHFVLVDKSGIYGPVVDRALARYHTRKKWEALQKYIASYSRFDVERSKVDLEKVPADALDPDKMMEKLSEAFNSPEQLDRLATPEGWAAEMARIEPFLREDRPSFEEPRYTFRRVDLPAELSESEDPEALARELKSYLTGSESIMVDGERKSLFAAIIIPADIDSKANESELPGMPKPEGIEYWSANLADDDLPDEIRKSVNDEYRRRSLIEKNVDTRIVEEIQKAHLPFTSKNPKKKEGSEQVSLADRIRQYAPIAFVYLLWVAIFTVAQMLLNNTIEEKSNRIIEVLLSSVTSRELMMGKLIGIAAVGLTMTGAWIASMVLILNWKSGPETEFIAQAIHVLKTSNLLPFFAVYFLLGYLFYAGIFLSIGSICNTIKEAQNFMGPVMLVMMVPLATMFFIPKDPNGTLATVLSWIPLYTPFVMMNRSAADPPAFDQIGTLVLMLVSASVVLWLSGKIFRIGILRTGQPPRLLELLRWLKG